MWSLTWVPTNVDNALYKCKPVFCCVQARHFSVFCWLLLALILDNGKGKLQDLCGYLPPQLKYWTLMRMVSSGQWDANIVVDEMRRDVLTWLLAPADGVIHLHAVCAYLLLVRLSGRDAASGQPWSLFRLKQRFQADLRREEMNRTERKWKRKLKQYEDAA